MHTCIELLSYLPSSLAAFTTTAVASFPRANYLFAFLSGPFNDPSTRNMQSPRPPPALLTPIGECHFYFLALLALHRLTHCQLILPVGELLATGPGADTPLSPRPRRRTQRA